MKLCAVRCWVPCFLLLHSSLVTESASTHARQKRTTGLAGYEDPYALSDALSAIERQRRRMTVNGPIQQQMLDDADSYFYPGMDEYAPESPEELRDLIQYVQSADSSPYDVMQGIDSLEQYPGYVVENKEDYPYKYTGYNRKLYSPEKRTFSSQYRPQRVVPTMEELEELFGSTNVPVKRLAPVRRQSVPKVQSVEDDEEIPYQSENNKAIKPEQDDTSTTEEESKEQEDESDLASKMKNLLEAAQKLEEQNSEKSEQESPPETDVDETPEVAVDAGKTEATQEQLEDLFSGAITDNGDVSDDNDNDGDGEEEEAVTTQEEEQDVGPVVSDNNARAVERLMEDYITQTRTMSKRGARGNSNMLEVGELLGQIEELKERLSRLQLLHLLEDKENDYLASALKYGTLDQIDDRSDYLQTEFNSIEKATEVEELIQLLSRENEETEEYKEAMDLLGEYLELDDTDDDEDEEEVQEDGEGGDEMMEKRGGLESEGWFDNPVAEDVSPLVTQDQPRDSAAVPIDDNAIEDFLQRGVEVPSDVQYPPEPEVNENVAEAEEQEAEVKKGALLQQLLQGLSTEDLQELVSEIKATEEAAEEAIQEEEEEEDEEEEKEAEEEEGVCPAVIQLSNNCHFADTFEIPLDDDARQLCVRHEMCYTCGNAFELSETNCDEGFGNTVVEECEGDNRCLRNALLFLKLMQRFHQYRPYSPGECSALCVESFIVDGV